jgi:hypothetical protein
VKYTDEVGIQEVTVSVTDKPINVTDKAISDADKPKGKTTTLKFLVTITKPTEEQDNETTEINLIAKTQDTITIEKGTTFAVEEYVEVEPKPDNLYLAFNDPDVSTLGTYKVKVTATTKDGKSISNTVELTVKVVDSIQKVTDTAAESDQDDANVERTTSLTPDVTKSIWSAGSEFRQQSYWEQTGATVIEWWKLLIDDPLKSLGLITGINLDANFDGILDIWGVDPSTLENTATNATTDSKTNPNVNKTIGVSQGATPAYSQFSDLAVNAWYQKAIEYAIDNGLMTGYGNDLFGPNDKVTRAQFTQIVYNREGKPIVPGKSKFPDVLPNKWYNNAIVWGETQTMVKGYSNGNFGPDDHITREQLMTIFHRYAPYLGLPVEEADESTLLNYKDGEMVSGYAKPAMAWALKVGIIQGKGDGVLDPRADASRAEVAQMMVNFIVKVIEKN